MHLCADTLGHLGLRNTVSVYSLYPLLSGSRHLSPLGSNQAYDYVRNSESSDGAAVAYIRGTYGGPKNVFIKLVYLAS